VSSSGVSMNGQRRLSYMNLYFRSVWIWSLDFWIWDCSDQFPPFFVSSFCVSIFFGGSAEGMRNLLPPNLDLVVKHFLLRSGMLM